MRQKMTTRQSNRGSALLWLKTVLCMASALAAGGEQATVIAQAQAAEQGEEAPNPDLTITIQHEHQRTAFVRMEQGSTLTATLVSATGADVEDVVLVADAGTGIESTRIDVGGVGPEPLNIAVPLPCDVRPGTYTLTASVTGELDGREVVARATFDYHICKRLPTRLPVVMWGGASFERMQEVGFTHRLEWMDHLDMAAWQAGEPIEFHSRMDDTRAKLNDALVAGLRFMGKISPGGYFKGLEAYEPLRPPYYGHDSYGKPTKHIDFSLTRLQQFAHDVGRSVANNVGMFPAFDLLLSDSEFRDSNDISYRPEARAAFGAISGEDIPALVKAKTGVSYQTIPDFPRDRIVPDDDKILAFYRWFWGGGDGYHGFVSNARRGLRGGGAQARLLWDPAVRCPSKWGSGGTADLIGHWSYVYPDPLVMGLATDEMFAMVKGGPAHQKVTKMTQIICYRTGTCDALPKDKSKWAEWEKRLPEAQFITVPPDLLEIGFWQKIARPIHAIMYHGSGSLWPSDPGGYDYTNPDTAPRLASLVARVIRPLGPALLEIPDRPADVAMLESFTSQMFHGSVTYGTTRNPVGRMHTVLSRAHMQTEVIYDETILRDGLDQYKVLVAPSCAVLTESVVGIITEWQNAGGILVGDEVLVPRLMPDLLITACTNGDKDELIAKAADLRQQLSGVYTPYADANSADAIVRVRTSGTTDYVFVVNDKRTYGDYIGQYQRVMEKGLPLSAKLTIARNSGVVHDLLSGKVVEADVVDSGIRFGVNLKPGEGRVYMITERPIAGLAVSAPRATARGAATSVTIAVRDPAGQPMDGVVPVRIDITDADGQLAEFSGWYAATQGTLSLDLDIATNDASGDWTVEATELASSRQGRAQFRVGE